MTEILLVIAAGFGAGVVSGLFGVGGGIVFVPALVLILDSEQVVAEATSLVAIIPVALVGAYRQRGYGNVDLRLGVTIGLISIPTAVGAAALANALPERGLQLLFAGLCIGLALRMVENVVKRRGSPPQPDVATTAVRE